MRMEYIVMLTAISNKKITKLVATRPSQEDSPIFPSPHSPQSLLRRFYSYYPQANHLQGFSKFHLISSHFISFHFIFVSSLSSLGANQHSYAPRSACWPSSYEWSSVQLQLYSTPRKPSTREFPHFPVFSLPMLMMKPRGFYLIINKGIWLLALAERPLVFPIR